eukprot:scaffold108979_cov33-Tisochrysis_lutea.AAC.3
MPRMYSTDIEYGGGCRRSHPQERLLCAALLSDVVLCRRGEQAGMEHDKRMRPEGPVRVGAEVAEVGQ